MACAHNPDSPPEHDCAFVSRAMTASSSKKGYRSDLPVLSD